MRRRHYGRRRRRSRGGMSLGGNSSILWLGLGAVAVYAIWKSGALKRIIGGAAAAGGPDQVDTDCPDDPVTGLDCSEESPATYLKNTGRSCSSCAG